MRAPPESLPLYERIKQYRPLMITLGIAAGSLTITSLFVDDEPRDPRSAFVEEYTNTDKCLSDTPYDPDQGAMLHVNTVNDAEVLTVIPQAANTFRPSVLFLTVGDSPGSEAAFTPADYDTGSFMYTAGCSVPAGY